MPEEFLSSDYVFLSSDISKSNSRLSWMLSLKREERTVRAHLLARNTSCSSMILTCPKEEYGAQPPIELVRQFMDFGGWYDRDDKEKPWLSIVDIIICSAMGPPGGGRAVVTQRL